MTQVTFDAALTLDAGTVAITSTGLGSVTNIDLGGGGTWAKNTTAAVMAWNGQLVLNVSDIDDADGNETYAVSLELGTDASFTTSILVGTTDIPRATGTGTFIVPVNNELNEVLYRYARLSLVLAGTTPSITLLAFLAKK